MTAQKSDLVYASDDTKFYIDFSSTNTSKVYWADEPASGYSSIYHFNKKADELFWKIELRHGQPFLLIINKNGKKQRYQLQFVARQWQWINLATGEARALNSPLSDEVNRLKNKLVGIWSSSVFSNQVIQDLASAGETSVMTALLEYDFKANGQFTKTIYLNKEVKNKIQGEWQLSEDGKYVLLQFQDKDGTYYGFSAEIKYFFYDELVLNHPSINPTDWEAMTEVAWHSFFFNKH
jgi:hypothetical protein